MSKQTFHIRVLHDATIYCDTSIEADSENAARALVLAQARAGQLTFEVSDGNGTPDPWIESVEGVC